MHTPLSFRRSRADFLILKFDRDFFSITGSAPDGNFLATLENGAIGEQRVWLDLRVQGGGEKGE